MSNETHANPMRWLILLLIATSMLAFAASRYSVAAPIQESDANVAANADTAGEAEMPIDRGSPEEVKPSGISLLRLLTRGGWFMVPLLLLSILVATISVERFLALRREKIFPPELVKQLSSLTQSEGGLDPRRAYQACQRYPSSASYIFRSLLVKVGRPQAELESAVSEAAQREATRLAQVSSWLTLAAAIAPLIGLLGTVWGITQAFYDTTQLVVGQNRAEALAQGIYTALVTTMTGLLIAIPAAVLSHYFENRIVQLLNEIEELCFNMLPQFERYEGKLRFTTGIPADEDAVVEPSENIGDGDYPPIPEPPSRRSR
ncbi:MotA/TolQ/ExbB proton channel family protein [Mariniblastus fucicola]|uniref:Biopolymer transport protein ExbB n=1 Tax=Mariniblastus fucicola TaxID=980251 RepID=A0A5B9P6P3_9BACT|nr:MotA/TolQ/ExbB proton channel family protein [Mariniblastus fucicola]QEG20326.1 Biopolymer transport protein ExbB [Mariniblastus fucicola]